MENERRSEFDVIGLGEVMLRMAPPEKERMAQGNIFEKNAGGSELNVVSGISLLGLRTALLTKLPDNNLGYYIKNQIRSCGVSDDYIIYDTDKHSRLGLYYYESGAYPRKPSVIYDRQNSSINSMLLNEINENMFKSCRIFHVSGITLALGERTREAALETIKKCRENGAMISFDVNFRGNLWTEEEARAVIEPILQHIDLLFISEETIRKMFGRHGEIKDEMRLFSSRYEIKMVVTSRRTVISPQLHTFDSLIFDAESKEFYSEEPYRNIQVIDRIGSGDAFVAGVLFAYLKYGSPQKCVEFGNAMAAVKNTVRGDLPSSDFEEIVKVIETHKSREQGSEMNR